MNPADPIILTAYLLCIIYFVYKIIDAFNDEFVVRLDEAGLKQQLEEQNLQDLLGISFKFDKQYEFEGKKALKQIGISISNKSGGKDQPDRYSIYVEWDSSALTDLDGRSRRVTRLMPGSTLDLFQTQVFSTVAPNTTLKETIVAEDMLQRKGENKDTKLDKSSPLNLEVEITKPLLDMKPDLKKASDAVKKRHEQFMKGQREMEFFLQLALRLAGPNRSPGGDRVYILCRFLLKKLPWEAGLPWNPR